MSDENKKEEEKKVLTIRDFKVMIEGMDMVLGDDWYPTEAQWKPIRAKIDLMIDTSERPVTNTRTMYPESNVVMPGGSIDNLVANFPQVPVAADIPIGETPLPPGGSALTPPQPAPAPEMTVVDGEAVRVHKTGSFV